MITRNIKKRRTKNGSAFLIKALHAVVKDALCGLSNRG